MFPAVPGWPTGGILARLLRLCFLKHCRVVGYTYWVSSQTGDYWSRIGVIWRKRSRSDHNGVRGTLFRRVLNGCASRTPVVCLGAEEYCRDTEYSGGRGT